jgi:hypothetical protein
MERPGDRESLHRWIGEHLGVAVPRSALLPGHAAPFDYLCHTFFEDERPRDCIVWANRGGGKTFLGATATALDLVFKPGIQVRILAGSLEQAGRMHAHLRALFERESLAPLVDGKITDRRLRLRNGSAVELLSASQASVRGTRVQKLRCDEVELFSAELWEAAQLVTRSARCGEIDVRGAVECLSTMHKPHGLMARLVDEAASGSRRLFRWGVADVLGPCEPERPCAGCALWPECQGTAKGRREPGHIEVEDALTMKRRVSLPVWQAEMLSLRPRRTDAVYPAFDRAVHVFEGESHDEGVLWLAGMDFGFRAPTAVLFACVDAAGVLRVMGERVEREVVMAEHARAIVDGPWGTPAWVGVDPAGHQRSGQTGRSDIAVLREAGLTVRAQASPIELGLALVTARLAPASGPPRLLVHARCRRLIEALERYHYPEDHPESREPVKDGHDHAADALRYLVLNLDQPQKCGRRAYA